MQITKSFAPQNALPGQQEHQANSTVEFKPTLNLSVVANKRFIYSESLRRWSEEKTGKLFIITVMAAHQYLSQACLIVCFGSIMCMDKESGFRQLMSLMGLRRVSYLSAHFILCESEYPTDEDVE